MQKQNDLVVVRKGEEFRFSIGSAKRNGSKLAKVSSGEIGQGCTFKCDEKLYRCSSVSINRSKVGQELSVVAIPSDYTNVAFDIPEVMLSPK